MDSRLDGSFCMSGSARGRAGESGRRGGLVSAQAGLFVDDELFDEGGQGDSGVGLFDLADGALELLDHAR